jgi:integrase
MRKAITDKVTMMKLPKVLMFLSSINRNSARTEKAYSSGLSHMSNFISVAYPKYNCETILQPILKNKINVYKFLEDFVSYLLKTKAGMTPKSISLYITALRSYLAYYDIDVIPSKFRRKVRMPKICREDEEPIDGSDVRKLLLSCNNRRLKTLILVLASGGMRVSEALAIRNIDLDFSVTPVKAHVRKEYSKTRVGRDVYISDEAAYFIKQWLDWKYNNPDRERKLNQEDLVFTVYQSKNPYSLYVKVWQEFDRLLKTVGMDEKKDGGIVRRRKITLHSFRRYVKTVISNQVGQDYSEWFLGHSKSPYWTLKEEQRREIYSSKCMKYLTFLDYATLEITGKNIESQMMEKDKEIQLLKQHELRNADAIITLSDRVSKLTEQMESMRNQD